MYAIIKAGNKQYKITTNQEIYIDLLKKKKRGDVLIINNVLMIGGKCCKIGYPFIKNASILTTVINNKKNKTKIKNNKIHVFKKNRRKGYHKLFGHRQLYTKIKINKIILNK